ncbi:helix-turn-helix domain-containing protein [Stappia sp.]|uniref:helix-turn-helix domain-containing protein n=1 Tax=Stappia sp. TaxID=1870903 RepID=UPI003C7B53EC
MKLISPSQCRAARAILNFTRADLADLSGISAAAIGAFETEATEARLASISRLRTAFEAKGVEFLDDDGVRRKRSNIRVYEGRAIHRQLLDEIYADLKDKGGEILIRGLTERKWESGDNEAFLDNHLARLKEAGVTERILVSEDDTVFVAPRHWYRKIPSAYFAPHTQWIFNGKVAMVEWGDIETLTIIENRALFNAEVRLFNCVWENVARTIDQEAR